MNLVIQFEIRLVFRLLVKSELKISHENIRQQIVSTEIGFKSRLEHEKPE